MIKHDKWITSQATRQGMITPFISDSINKASGDIPVLSFGLSSYGYDIRLSPKDFKIFRHIPGTVIDPKRFNPENLEPAKLHKDEMGEFFILPGHSYGLGVAVEHIEMPRNVTAYCIGKSTYARCGIIAAATPIEAGWKGHITLEFSNSSPADARIYANEGCVQLLFFEGEPCEVSYADRGKGKGGKYQGQKEEVVTARA